MRFIAKFFSVVLLAASLTQLQAQSNLVLFVSGSGDYIGGGSTYVTTNESSFTISGGAQTVTIGAFGFSFYIDAPNSDALTVSNYTGTSRYPFNSGNAGFDISGNGRGCNQDCGTFQVFEIHTNASGAVDRFWCTFSNRCECSMAPQTGEIRYHSQLAPASPVPKTIQVPGTYSTIQSAIDASSLFGAVDTVLVGPGTYHEAINFKGKRVRVVSAQGPAVTSIVPPSNGTAVTLTSGETSEALIAGFTIVTGGTAISVSSSSPTIASNIIVNAGTGINVNFSSPNIFSNKIVNGSGNALYLNGAATPLIEGNIIQSNNVGISMFAAGSPTIRNNTIANNRSDGMNMVNQSDANIIQNLIIGNGGSGINWLVPSGARGPYVINNTIAKNGGAGIYADGYDIGAKIINNIILAGKGNAIYVGGFNDSNPPLIRYNDVYSSTTNPAYAGLISNLTGVAGNISADPLIACIPSDDFHLLGQSACIDSGTNGADLLPASDLDGNTRILYGKNSLTIDIGAYEFDTNAPTQPCLYISCPPSMTVSATPGQTSAVVNYPAPTGTPVATLSSSPPSGSTFPGGTNTVTCTATYAGNSIDCSFTITVTIPPFITNNPSNLTVSAGQTIDLNAGASGSTPLTYRWTFEGTPISGATASTLTITNAQSANEGVYRVVVSNSAGTATSSTAYVRVTPSVPTIVANPASLTVSTSSNAVFSVVASGSQPFSYQWFFNGNSIANGTLASYSISSAQPVNAGTYTVVVSNGLGTTTSSAATLTVSPVAPYFTVQPTGGTLAIGNTKTFSATAGGSLPISYQWQLNGTTITNATQNTFTVSNLTLNDAGSYTVVASNSVGTTTSAVANLVIYQTPVLLQGLSNQVVDAGSTVTLTANATAVPAPTFTWQLNGTAIASSGSSLTITNIQPSQTGYYKITASNAYGNASSTARISVVTAPGFVTAWGDNSGGQTNVPVSMNDIVAVSGGDYHSVALRRNGTLLAWGYNGDGQTTVPTNALRFVSIASGAAHNLAVLENGSVIGWGRNDAGQRTIPGNVTQVLSLAAGDSHSLALLLGGTVSAWGDNSFGQITVPPGLNGVRAIAAGRNHNLALRTNGTVIAWGYNAYGQTNVPALNDAMAIAAGYLHSVALRSNGTVVVWGDNTFNQTNIPAGLTNVVAIAAGDFHTAALRGDGTVVEWGDDTYGQLDVPANLAPVSLIASGNYHVLALQPAIMLTMKSTASGLVIQWNGAGVLQWAPSVNGPFSDILGPSGSFTNTDTTTSSKFFRLRR